MVGGVSSSPISSAEIESIELESSADASSTVRSSSTRSTAASTSVGSSDSTATGSSATWATLSAGVPSTSTSGEKPPSLFRRQMAIRSSIQGCETRRPSSPFTIPPSSGRQPISRLIRSGTPPGRHSDVSRETTRCPTWFDRRSVRWSALLDARYSTRCFTWNISEDQKSGRLLGTPTRRGYRSGHRDTCSMRAKCGSSAIN